MSLSQIRSAPAARVLLDSGQPLTAANRKSLKAIADPASGRVFIDADWWRWLHGTDQRQVAFAARAKAATRREALEAMADPRRNDKAHERAVAARKLAELKAKTAAAGFRPVSTPGLEELDRAKAERDERLRRWHEESARRWAETGERIKAEQAAAAARAEQAAAARAERVNTTKAKKERVNTAKEETVTRAERVNTTEEEAAARTTERVNTTKQPRSADRHKEPNRDRHRPGYMRDYMKAYRARKR
jgi:hypothetical protein